MQSVNWAKGLTAEGRPILVPGVEPSLQGTKICPSTSGATNWMSPAYNPDTGLFYVAALEGCGINTKSFEKFRPGGFPFDATGYVESPEEPRQLYVRALELTTGKLKWEFKQIGSRAYGAGLALDRRLADFRRLRSGNLHRAGCKYREAAVALQHRAGDLRLANDVYVSKAGSMSRWKPDRT